MAKDYDILSEAHKQIESGCDLGDDSRNRWLEHFETMRRQASPNVTWITGTGEILVTPTRRVTPPPPNAAMVMSRFSDEELVRELERRAAAKASKRARQVATALLEGG